MGWRSAPLGLLRTIAFASLAAVAALALAGAVGPARAIAAEPPIVPHKGETYPLGTRVTGPCDPAGDPDGGLQSAIDYEGYRDDQGRWHYSDYRDLHNDWANSGSPSDGWEIRAVRLRDAAGRLLPKCAPLTLRHPGRYELCVVVPSDPEVLCASTVHFEAAGDDILTGSICISTSHAAGSGSTRSLASLRPQSPASGGLLRAGASPPVGGSVALPSALQSISRAVGDHCGIVHQLQPQSFENCAAAVAWLHHTSVPGNTTTSEPVNLAAFSLPALRFHYVAPLRRKRRPRVVDVVITYSVDTAKSFVGEAVFSWPSMTTEEKQAVAKLQQALLVHEHGHLTVAKRYAAKHPDKFTARDRAEAKKLVREYVKEFGKSAEAEQHLYDDVTHHGTTQQMGPSVGFPGGPNTVFTCP